jgi:hypothetical protein
MAYRVDLFILTFRHGARVLLTGEEIDAIE